MTASDSTAKPEQGAHFLLGMRLDHIAPDDFISAFVARAQSGEAGYCCVSNVHQCILTYDDPQFRAVVNKATFVVPDSTVLQQARRLRFGASALPTMRGADLMAALCERAAQEGLPIALLGGRDEAVLQSLRQRLLARFPALRIAFAYAPPFHAPSAEEDRQLTAAIRRSGARIVFVGLGCPKQENWMAAHSGELDAMLIGVGAAFDFNAGLIPASPHWVHQAGLEWLYRLGREPRRLWRRYLGTSPRFLWLLTADYARALLRPLPRRARNP